MVRAISFDSVSKWSNLTKNTEQYKQDLTTKVDTDGSGDIQVNELVAIGFKEEQAVYLINKYGSNFGFVDNYNSSKDQSKLSNHNNSIVGEGIIFALTKLDQYDGIIGGSISANALQDLSNEIDELKETDPAEHTRLTTKPGEYAADEKQQTAFDTYIDGQKKESSPKDINLNKDGTNVSNSIDAFIDKLEADGNGVLDEDKLRLLGFSPEGLQFIANKLQLDVTSKEDVKKLLIYLDGNNDGIIRKADINAINNGIDVVTTYITSKSSCGSQPEGEDTDTAALVLAKEFIKEKTSVEGDTELKPLDIDRVLFANRPDLMDESASGARESIRKGIIAEYGKDGKITANQLAEALVSLDAKSHRSNLDKKYDGIIAASDLEALAAKADETTESENSNETNTNNTSGNGPSQDAINKVYSPLPNTEPPSDLKDRIKQEMKNIKKKTEPKKGLLNLKNIALAAIITGLFLKIKQPAHTAAPIQPWPQPHPRPYPMAYGQPPIFNNGMMNWVG